MITDSIIQAAVQRLKNAASPAKIILFGSYARGDASEDSDLDFLVIEHSLQSQRAEMVRLRDVLRPMRIPVDVLVTSVEKVREWGDLPGTVLYEALHEGKVRYCENQDFLYDVARNTVKNFDSFKHRYYDYIGVRVITC